MKTKEALERRKQRFLKKIKDDEFMDRQSEWKRDRMVKEKWEN